MDKKIFVIRSDDVISRVTAFLNAQTKEPLLEVIVKDHKKDRSLSQNSLMWVWIKAISDEWGWTKADVHRHFKKEMLVNIFERDDLEYAAMIQSVREVYKTGLKGESKIMADWIIEKTSTTDANVKQFTEYLNDIENDMISKGFVLPHPDDYRYAMGIKKG